MLISVELMFDFIMAKKIGNNVAEDKTLVSVFCPHVFRRAPPDNYSRGCEEFSLI